MPPLGIRRRVEGPAVGERQAKKLKLVTNSQPTMADERPVPTAELLPALDVYVPRPLARIAENQGYYHFESIDRQLRRYLNLLPLASEEQVNNMTKMKMTVKMTAFSLCDLPNSDKRLY